MSNNVLIIARSTFRGYTWEWVRHPSHDCIRGIGVNEFGGHATLAVGKPNYIARRWAQITKGANRVYFY